MSAKRLISLFAGLCLVASTSVMAGPGDNHHRDSRQRHQQSVVKHDKGGPGWGNRGNAGPTRHANRPQARHDHHGPRWKRGDRLPANYRSQRHMVNDWHRHGLRAPARGQRWVSTGTEYLLIAAATGVIMQAVLGR